MPNLQMLPRLSWSLSDAPGEALDPRLLPLLRALRDGGSLATAVAECRLSYRAAWGLLRAHAQRLQQPLALLERGRGARLAPLGERLLAVDAAAAARLEPALKRLVFDLDARPALARGEEPRLAVAASHDLALEALRESTSLLRGLALEVSFMGSLDALEQYAAGRARLAGFHVPLGRGAPALAAPYLRWLRPQRDRLLRFVDREQGLIVARGNPHRLRSLADVAGGKLRFVNRQRSSGTRLAIDRSLQDAGIERAQVLGYGNEEFTHAAVAATVASGGADAGFGLRAAAARYSLAFVPLLRERYWLAVRSADLGSEPLMRLVRYLRGTAFAGIVRRLPGYRAPSAGEVATIDVLQAPRRAV